MVSFDWEGISIDPMKTLGQETQGNQISQSVKGMKFTRFQY